MLYLIHHTLAGLFIWTPAKKLCAMSKSAHNTVSCADLFYLNRGGAFARSVRSVETFRNHPIKIAASFFEPRSSGSVISRRRRKAQSFGELKIRPCELFQKIPAFVQRLFQE